MKKKILFISIHFREYIERIKSKMESVLNAKVDLLYIDNHASGIEYYFNKISCGRYDQYKYFKEQNQFFKKITDNNYDCIFVLVGRGLYIEGFRNFLKKQNRAKKILYLWDDVERVKEFFDIKSFFNKVYSFNKNDCEKYSLSFLPLFYCDDYIYDNSIRKDIEFSCTGVLYSFREKMLSSLLYDFPENKYKWYIHLKATKGNILKAFLQGKRQTKPKFISYYNINLSENADILKRSKIVIDMPYPTQHGLTIRTFEALAAKTKMITTSKTIKDYDFYNSNNILIVDRYDPLAIKNFIDAPYNVIDKKIVDQYSISNWITSLFRKEGFID